MGLCQNIDLVYVHSCVNNFQYVESFHVIKFIGYVMLLIICIIFIVGKNIFLELHEENDMNMDSFRWLIQKGNISRGSCDS